MESFFICIQKKNTDSLMTKKQSQSPKKWSAFLGCKTLTSRQLRARISKRMLTDFNNLCLTQEIHTGFHIQLNISAITDLILVTSVLLWKGSKTHLTTTEIFYKSSGKSIILSSKKATGYYMETNPYVNSYDYINKS